MEEEIKKQRRGVVKVEEANRIVQGIKQEIEEKKQTIQVQKMEAQNTIEQIQKTYEQANQHKVQV